MNRYPKLSFPLKLKMLRLESGRSQAEFSKELGISRSCLANYETGKRQPDNEMLVKIADSFNVMTDYLVDRSSYRNLTLSENEKKETDRIREFVRQCGNNIDISGLELEHKVSLIEFFSYIKQKDEELKQREKDFKRYS